uniref:Serpentine receptor class gamma n=1 Tax=Panagrellus redivivus TaxID=6233 RepID=A0A7E4VTC0_PANRE
MESDLIFYLTHLYMVPTVLLYFFLFYVLYFSREKVNFSSEFYKICAIQDIAVLVQIVDFYLTRKLPMSQSASPVLRYLPESGMFPMLLQFSIYYTASLMSLGNGVGSLNRASTIFLGARHQFLWTRSMKFIYLFLFIAPLTLTWNLLFNVVNISFDAVQTTNAIMWHIATPQWTSWMNSGQCILFCAIISDAWSFIICVMMQAFPTLNVTNDY